MVRAVSFEAMYWPSGSGKLRVIPYLDFVMPHVPQLRMSRFLLAVFVALIGCGTQTVFAAEASKGEKLIVGTKVSPPFAFKNAEGDWTGISIELWSRIADELEIDFEFREASLEQLISGLETGELDAAVAALSVTAERQQRVDFCHPHFTTGLGIAVPINSQGDIWGLLRRIVSRRLLSIMAIMVAIIAASGLLFWRLERGVNPGMFGGKRRQGIEMGIWWSTILLLGHKGINPVSTAGRLVAVSAMVASFLVLSVITGVITSVLTVHQLDSGIDDPNDLRNARVVTVSPSTAADYLTRRRVSFRAMPTAEAALQAVAEGRADAAVYDKPLLRYLVTEKFSETVQVLSVSFNTQEYAIALAPDSPLRKPLNTALLSYRASDLWEEMIFRYLGE